MTIKEWPEGERPREKFIRLGSESLSDAELLSLMLRTGLRGRTVLDLSRDLLTRFGGLRKLLSAPEDQLLRAEGIGFAKMVQLKAVREIGMRVLAEQLQERPALESSSQAADYLSLRMRDLPREEFAGVFLDTRHRVLRFEVLFTGTINAAAVHPREVVKRALSLNAAALIIAHNHPSGVTEPSQADIALTHRLRDALALVDVRLLDHLIVGEGVCCSLRDQGLI